MKNLLLYILVLTPFAAFSQGLIVEGTVKDSISGDPLVAEISVSRKDTSGYIWLNGAVTDSAGNYRLELQKGNYRIYFSTRYHLDYVIFTNPDSSFQQFNIKLPLQPDRFALCFNFNSSNIADLDSATLYAVATHPRMFKRYKMSIIAGADSTENNPEILAKERAREVEKYLVAYGIPKRKLLKEPGVEAGTDKYDILSNQCVWFCTAYKGKFSLVPRFIRKLYRRLIY